MAAKLHAIIPLQSFELVLQRLGEILALEFANQHVLDNAFVAPRVYINRFIPINAETEVPAINVSYYHGKYENENVKKQDGVYVFNIDVYTAAPTTSEVSGDTKSRSLMDRLMGMVRSIIMNPAYLTLGYTAPSSIVIGRTIHQMLILQQGEVADMLSSVCGRVQVMVKAIETMELVVGVPLHLLTTKVLLNESDKGFYYEYQD